MTTLLTAPLPVPPDPDPETTRAGIGALPPVWLLDVDGVINAIAKNPDRTVWPADAWTRTRAVAGGRSWPILAAQPVLDFLTRVHESGAAEIRWHTTWRHDAARYLAPELGLPEFGVQPTREFSSTAGGAYRPAEDRWWKIAAAEQVTRSERRTLVWTDDDLAFEQRGGALDTVIGAPVPSLLVAPPANVGLTPKQLRQIAEFLGINPFPQAAQAAA